MITFTNFKYLFQKNLHLEEKSKPSIRGWLKVALKNNKHSCEFCGVDLDIRGSKLTEQVEPSTFIPFYVGGVSHFKNNVLICDRCFSIQNNLDMVFHKNEMTGSVDSKSLLARRVDALNKSLNHVVPLTVATDLKNCRKQGYKHLAARFAYPRIRMLAGVFKEFGWFAVNPLEVPHGHCDRLIKGVFKNHHQYQVGGWLIYKVKYEHFHKIAFFLISRNVLLQELEVGFGRETAPEGSPEHFNRWHVLLPGDTWCADLAHYGRYKYERRRYLKKLKEEADWEAMVKEWNELKERDEL